MIDGLQLYSDEPVAGAGKDLGSMQTALDDENPHAPSGFVLPGVRVKLTAALEQIRKKDRNVLAMLPGHSNREPGSRSWVLVGAHYDHLGKYNGSEY